MLMAYKICDSNKILLELLNISSNIMPTIWWCLSLINKEKELGFIIKIVIKTWKFLDKLYRSQCFRAAIKHFLYFSS